MKVDDGSDHSNLDVVIMNASSLPITDLVINLELPHLSADLERRTPSVDRHGNRSVGFGLVQDGQSTSISLKFTDAYFDRWQLSSDNSLSLLNPRIIREISESIPHLE